MENFQQREGKVAKTIEKQTAKIPSDMYLWSAVGSMALSLGCFIAGKRHLSLFFGQWAPSLLIIGVYNKLVKQEGHDKEDDGEELAGGDSSVEKARALSLS
jgi:hypothetical protein